MGDGMSRLLGLASAVVNARDGILLIDEIGTGLHYSIQSEMWRLVFENAKRFNVQVFATTHNDDCIRGFQKAAQSHEDEGVLIRLYKGKNGDVKGTLYDEEDLAVAVEHDVEVR